MPEVDKRQHHLERLPPHRCENGVEALEIEVVLGLERRFGYAVTEGENDGGESSNALSGVGGFDHSSDLS